MDFPFLPQGLLFSPEELHTHPLRKYDLLFSVIDTSPLEETSCRGRPPFSRPALLRTFVYKNVRCFPSLTELATELNENQTLSAQCGFDPLSNAPSVQRFSSFLRDLQTVYSFAGTKDVYHYLVFESIFSFKIIRSSGLTMPVDIMSVKASSTDISK